MGNCIPKNNYEETNNKELYKFSEKDKESIKELLESLKLSEDISEVKFIPRNIFGYLDTYKYKIYGDCQGLICFTVPGIYKILRATDRKKKIVETIFMNNSEKIEYIILYPYNSTVKRIPNTLQLVTNCKNISIVTNFPHEVY